MTQYAHTPGSHRDDYGRSLALSVAAALGLLIAFFVWAPDLHIAPYRLVSEDVRARPAPEFVELLPPSVTVVRSNVVADGIDLLPALTIPSHDGVILDTVGSMAPPVLRPSLPRRAHLYAFEPLPPGSGRPVFRMTPAYGPLPLGLDLDKTVIVKVRVSPRGQVVDARVAKGVSYTLDQQALMAAWQCRLSPRATSQDDDQPDRRPPSQNAWVTLPYEFVLEP